MEIRKLLLMGCIMVGSAVSAVAQTTKDYYQPTIKRAYASELSGDDNALSLYTDKDEETISDGFQQHAGLTLRSDKQTKKSGKKLERAYERSARKQKQVNRAEDREIRKNQRVYLQKNRKTA